MANKSAQKWLGKVRPPRVHIEYEVTTGDAQKKIELPFVMGVMSDLSGKSNVEKKALPDRDFVEFDMDNFEQKMEAMAPRAAFVVENTLSGEGKLGVDLTFKSLEDFTPGAVAQNVPALAKLLEARQQLSDLMAYMDGRDGAQELIDKLLKDPEMMKALAAAKAGEGEQPAQP